jgi:predicted nucleotidyltransferase
MSIKERWRKFGLLPENTRDRLANLSSLFEREGVLLAYLFGSLARQEKGKDVDPAVLLDKDDLSELGENVREALGTERVDLVSLEIASPVLRFEIVSNVQGRDKPRSDEEGEIQQWLKQLN